MTYQEAANDVLVCLQAMGENSSNPVLEVIERDKPFIADQKYPENKLIFNNSKWRAYYHSHGEPYRFDNEHGHFHIFHKTEKNDWTHIAALSINSQGQPQKWFVTNRWVTDENWQMADRFPEFLADELEVTALLLVERWLYAMLVLYQDEIKQLLQQRDEKVMGLAKKSSFEGVLEDRDHYILAELDIQLQGKLTKALMN